MTSITPSAIEYEMYQNETQLFAIKKLMDVDLSEPYSIFTYRYFINNWPHLCLLATTKINEEKVIIGAIVCKCDMHESRLHSNVKLMRGYIAMLAVDKPYRKLGIGSELVKKVIEQMKISHDCDEVVLETEAINHGALRLYENLGFLRSKRLHKYYLNGGDAFRLLLPIKPVIGCIHHQQMQTMQQQQQTE